MKDITKMEHLLGSVVGFESTVELFRFESNVPTNADDGSWCIAIRIKKDNVYLYMAETDLEFRFQPLTKYMGATAMYQKQKCLELVDFINQQRGNKGLTDKAFAYNPYTGEVAK